MSERRPQSRYVPLRVRFRTPSEQLQWEREHTPSASVGQDPASYQTRDNTPVTQAELKQARQIKELVRLGNILRADLSLNEILQHIAASASACTGFRVLIINLLEESSNYLRPVAFGGITEEEVHMLQQSPITVQQMYRLMRPEFRISQSFFIPHEQIGEFSDIVWGKEDRRMESYQEGQWHQDDALLIPFYSPRKQQTLGLLSLDEPEDGKLPTQETIEILELFANQAAVAIDNANLFQERESEHRALEEAVALLSDDLKQIQPGDLRVRIRSSHEKLQPISNALDSMLEAISGLMGEVQMVTQAVDEHTRDVQHSYELLLRDAHEQKRQVDFVSGNISDISNIMHQVSSRAGTLSVVALEAMQMMMDGRKDVDRAVEGMGQVRETTMASTRIMKRLGETGQEINDAVVDITDLTRRMHLLALNAAIEAARASEHGQGFTAIAQELRTLAITSADAAKKVAGHIRSIQLETAAVSQSVEQSTQQVVLQTDLVIQTGISLDAISVVTDQMAKLVEGICSAADSQVQSSNAIITTIEQTSLMTSETAQHMQQMQASVAHLVELTNSLRSRLALIRVNEP